jgi:peptide chain release factor 1
MLEKLSAIYQRFKEIEEEMNNPAVIADMKRFIRLNKDYKELQKIVKSYFEFKKVVDNI